MQGVDAYGATVRRAVDSDLPKLCALLDRYYIEWDIWQRDSPSTVLADLQDPVLGFLLAHRAGILAGCVLCRPLPSLESSAECKRLFVAPEFRGQGLADLLMNAAEAAVGNAGIHWIYLDSKAEFSTAIALYHRRGYEECPRFNDNAQATMFLRKRSAPAGR